MRRAYNRFELGCKYLCSCLNVGWRPAASTPGSATVVNLKVVLRIWCKEKACTSQVPDGTEAMVIVPCGRDCLPLGKENQEFLRAIGIYEKRTLEVVVPFATDRFIVVTFGEPEPIFGCQPLTRWELAKPEDLRQLAVSPEIDCTRAPFLFRQAGAVWNLRFAGVGNIEESGFSAKRANGLLYYSRILARPHRTISSFDILGIQDESVVCVTHSMDLAFDNEGMAAIRRERKRLSAMIEKAKRVQDGETAQQARADLQHLEAFSSADCRRRDGEGAIKQARNINGRHPAARAKNAIDSALRRARVAIRHDMPELEKHLEAFVVCDGDGFRYCPPDPTPCWQLV